MRRVLLSTWSVRALTEPTGRLMTLALGTALLALAACRAVGPNYTAPPPKAAINVPTANGPFTGAANAAFSGETAPGPWWRLYESPELDTLVSDAFSANTDLRAAEANLERSKALVEEARAARQPMAEVNFDPSYQQLSPESFLHAGPLAPLGLYDTGV